MACEAARARLDCEDSRRVEGIFETGVIAGARFSCPAPYMMRAKLRLDITFSVRATSRGDPIIVRQCAVNAT